MATPLFPAPLPLPPAAADAVPLLPPTAYAPPALPLPPEPIESPLPLAAREVPPLPLPLPAPEPLLDLAPAPSAATETPPTAIPVATPAVEPGVPAQPEADAAEPTIEERVEAALAGMAPERAAQLRPTLTRAITAAQGQADVAEQAAMAARESEARLAPEREAFARAERSAADARQAAAHDLAAFRMEATERRREAGERDFGEIIATALSSFLSLAATARHGNFAETANRVMQQAVERRARRRAQVDKEIASQEEALRAQYDLAGTEADIASRRYELAKVLESDRLAADLRVALADVADNDARVMLDTIGGEIRNQSEAAMAGLEAEAEAKRFEAQRAEDKEKREERKLQLDIDRQKHQAKMDRQRISLERQRVKLAKEEWGRKKVLDMARLANEEAELALRRLNLDHKTRERSVILPDMQAVQVNSPKAADEIRQQMTGAKNMAILLDELIDLEEKHGIEWFQSQEAQKMRSKWVGAILEAKNVHKLGVIAGPDLPLLEQWLGASPESTVWTQAGRFREVRQQLEQGLTNAVQSAGAVDAVVDIPVSHGPAEEAALTVEEASRQIQQLRAPVSGQRTPVKDRISAVPLLRDAIRAEDKTRDWFVPAAEATADELDAIRAQRAEMKADQLALKRSVPIAGSTSGRERNRRLLDLSRSISDADKIERALVKELEGDYKRALNVWRRLSDNERKVRTDLEDTLRRTSRATGKPLPPMRSTSPLPDETRRPPSPVTTGPRLPAGQTFIPRP